MQTRQAGLESTGEIRLRDLVKEALRMWPSRVIVGEVRAEECLDLVLPNAGLPGMCTLHANSAREARSSSACTLPLLAESISARFVVPTVASSVDLVVHLGIDAHGVAAQRDASGAGAGRERHHRGRDHLRARGRRAASRIRDAVAELERFERIGIYFHQILNGGF